jgi:hypothetical protein
VYVQNTSNSQPVPIENVAPALVLALGHRRSDGLYRDLRSTGIELHAIGDCQSPRTVEEATLEGLKISVAI